MTGSTVTKLSGISPTLSFNLTWECTKTYNRSLECMLLSVHTESSRHKVQLKDSQKQQATNEQAQSA